MTKTSRRSTFYYQRILTDPWGSIIEDIEHAIRDSPECAQSVLNAEYRNPNGPRYTLIQWLKRHRLHNPTVRTIHKP